MNKLYELLFKPVFIPNDVMFVKILDFFGHQKLGGSLKFRVQVIAT